VLAAAVPLALLVIQVARPTPALAENVVNVTFHVPAQVEINPCTPGDIINLSGDIHVVITTTADAAGGYRVDNHLNSQLSGASILTGLKYANSTTNDEEWYARPPFPAVHTHTYDFELVSHDRLRQLRAPHDDARDGRRQRRPHCHRGQLLHGLQGIDPPVPHQVRTERRYGSKKATTNTSPEISYTSRSRQDRNTGDLCLCRS